MHTLLVTALVLQQKKKLTCQSRKADYGEREKKAGKWIWRIELICIFVIISIISIIILLAVVSLVPLTLFLVRLFFSF